MLRIDHDQRRRQTPPAEDLRTAAEFYPLRPGNTWTYEIETNGATERQIVRVLSVEQIGGASWSVVESTIEGTDNRSRSLLRTDESRLLEYRNNGTDGRLLIDFAASTALRADPSVGFVETEHVDADSAGMTFHECVTVATGQVDNEVGTYAPGVGLVESTWLSGSKRLVHAEIDGLQFPN